MATVGRLGWTHFHCSPTITQPLIVIATLFTQLITGAVSQPNRLIPSGLPRLLDATKDGLSFHGDTTARDYFRLLEVDGHHLLIGGRNAVYNVSTEDFSAKKIIDWPSDDKTMDNCVRSGFANAKEVCQNYIRVVSKDGSDKLLVCGTNSYEPTCRQYKQTFGYYTKVKTFLGYGITPYHPLHNSTSLLADGMVFAGTVSDKLGDDPVIQRMDVTADRPPEAYLRTDLHNPSMLNNAQFAGSSDSDRHAYFWWREDAQRDAACVQCRGGEEKQMYARVGRLCKNDRGMGADSTKVTSFVKARLNCSLPGDYHFYFDEIEAISSVVRGQYFGGSAATQLVYAVFNTPYANIKGSAVCAYSLKDINDTLSSGVSDSVAKLRNCPQEGVSDKSAVTYARNHPLVDKVVKNFFDQPILLDTRLSDRFTQIAVDPHVVDLNNDTYDVLFVGTDQGRVMKVLNVVDRKPISNNQKVSSIHIETLSTLTTSSPVRNLMILPHHASSSVLVVIGDREVRRVPVERCARARSCSECVKLRDPYCAWDVAASKCRAEMNWKKVSGNFAQNIRSGVSPKCEPTRPSIIVAASSSKEQPSPNDAGTEIASPSLPRPRLLQNCTCKKPPSTAESRQQDYVLPPELPVQISPVGNSENRPCRKDDAVSVERPAATAGYVYSAQVLAIAVTASSVVALIVGLIGGYMCRSWNGAKRLSRPQSFANKRPPPSASALASSTLKKKQYNNGGNSAINAYEPTPPPLFNGHTMMDAGHNTDEPLSAVQLSLDLDDRSNDSSLKMNDLIPNGGSTLPRNYRAKQMYL